MQMMQIMIEVSDELYNRMKIVNNNGMGSDAIRIILNGTVLPKGHGRLIDSPTKEGSGMTKEEQIERLIKIKQIGSLDDKDRQALNIQIKALKKEVSTLSSTKQRKKVIHCSDIVQDIPPAISKTFERYFK